MLYLKGENKRIIVLETMNLEKIKEGHPAVTPDDEIVICWTPDPKWLAQKIKESRGEPDLIAAAIDEASKRPQQAVPPPFPTRVHKLGREN